MEPGKDDEAVLDEHRSRLRRVRDHPPAEPLPDNANDEVTASTDDGAVRVMAQARRLVRVEIATSVLARPRTEVSAVLRETINDAVSRSQAGSPRAGDPGPNLGAIGEQLDAFARQSGAELRRIQDAVEQNMTKLAGKGDVQIRGNASPQHVDSLFEGALDVVRSMQAALDGGSSEPISGEGQDDDQEITAVVTAGELTELTLTGFALQMPRGELAAGVSDAVNEALDEWEQRSGDAAQPGVDVEALRQLGERADAVRAQSMQHLRNYTASMTSIMRNVG